MLFIVKTESLPKYFGEFGGQFVPETLMPALEEFEQIFLKYRNDPEFKAELEHYLVNYVGRPSPLYYAKRLTEHYGGAKIYLKREDLNHTGAHKINNAIAQALLAKRIGKKEIIAETGAGQHGVATATACALLGLNCKVFMGEEDIRRQAPNVKRMKLLGAEVIPVTSGTRTLKDATSEAIRYWVSNVADTHYIIGSAVGPHPYPTIVREFQKVIGEESKEQIMQHEGKLPDYIIACVGGGSNAIGIFYPFLEEAVSLFEKSSESFLNHDVIHQDVSGDSGKNSKVQLEVTPERLASSEQAELTDASMMTAQNERNAADEDLRKGVRLIAIEASGHGLETNKQAASITKGKPGVLHGSMSYLLQDEYGQIQEAHSISAGLDYPGIGPEHSFLHKAGLVDYQSCTDDEALAAFKLVCKLEGIIPALETSHAFAHLEKLCPKTKKNEIIIVNLSGRGDKDLDQID